MVNIYRCKIISIDYEVIDNITYCTISWRNPYFETINHSKGVAKCNPKDYFDRTTGRRIAESRAKLSMYYKYKKQIRKELRKIDGKYNKLIEREINHTSYLINH